MPPIAPAEYPPAFDSEDVISKPTDPEDERIEVGIAIVGAGPAGLACANNGSGFTPANQTVEGAEIQISFFLQRSVTFDAMIIEEGLQIS